MSDHRTILASLLALLLTCSALAGQNPPAQVSRGVLQKAASDFQQGHVTEAEQALRSALKQAPRDPSALGLLGVILDSQKRYDEAARAYQEALVLAPGSPSLLNNLGNHYMAQGKPEQARAAYLKVVAAEPRHANANLQLATLSLTSKQGPAALKCLERLPLQDQASPSVAILRARALKLSGQDKAAENLLEEVEKNAGNDSRISFSVGMALVDWQRYSDAENAFTRALDVEPTNFDILYNLALAAQHASHLRRAQEVYQVALKLRPNDPDCVFNLAAIYTQTGHADEAIVPLIQAHNAAPERADILFALAQTTQEIGFYGDAATAIDQYLKLKPHDDIARRERGFCLVRSAQLDKGLEDLRWYAQKHPRDARGFYELAIAETVREPDKALQHFNQALAIDPKLNAARYARGVLYYQQGKTEESIADLKLVLKTEPNDFRSLDALGQDFLRLGQYREAGEALQCAFKLAPKDPKVLTHYSRVLIRLDRKEEAEKLMAAFRALGPEEGRRRPYGGLFDFLSLPPEQQFARYMENLQRTIATRPNDPGLRVQLGKTLLRQGKPEEAIEAFRTVQKLTSNPDLLATCGKTLLSFEQYGPAREFLEPAVAANPSVADLRLDLAIAVFHSANAGDSLKVLEQTPPEQRKGDYFLLRAQILDAMQKPEEAVEALNRGFNTAPTRSDLYFQGSLFLIKHQQYKRAIEFLVKANQAISDTPELQLLQAMAYEMVRDHDSALRVLTQIESRWPEWALPYMVEGITLAIRLRSAEAKPVLENAIALGADNGISNYYLALVIVNSTPERVEEASQAISKALQTTPEDFYVQSLAGKIDYLRGDNPSALNHLNAALRLWPEMIEAHQTLAGVYKAMGEKEKSVAELKEILRIKQENPTADQMPPFPMDSLLFTVRPPLRPPS
jgi:tetratricopeptide (TPR) repeat protein